MPIYYVKTTGDDGESGLTEALAWLTPTHAFQTVVAGDTVYIAPGVYRNESGWTLTNAGSSGNLITYQGDPECEHFSEEDIGYVRLTGCDSDELPKVTTKVIDAQKDYVTFKNLIIDGTKSGTTFGLYQGNGTERIAENCIVFAGNVGFYYGTQSDCIAFAGIAGFDRGTHISCISFSGEYGFYYGTSNNCISFGGFSGFYSGTYNNCISFGGEYGFPFGTHNNCISLSSNYGFYDGVHNNCIALVGKVGFHSGALTTCKALYCKTASSGTSGDAVTEAKHIGFTDVLFMLKNLASILKPTLFFEKDFGDNSIIPSVTEDISGQPRRMHDGTIDVGAFEYSNVEMDWSNYKVSPPGVKITRKGVHEIDFPVKDGDVVVVKVQVKFDVSGDNPQLILKGNGIATQTDTATGDGSDWEELTVTATATLDTNLTARFYQQDTTAAKYAIFSDWKIPTQYKHSVRLEDIGIQIR